MSEKETIYSITIDDQELVEKLRYYNEHPEEILNLPLEQQRHYLRGVFDAIGSVFIDEVGSIILCIKQKDTRKLGVYQKILGNFDIIPKAYYSTLEGVEEPSQLLIVGLLNIHHFIKEINMEHPAKRERFFKAWTKLVDSIEIEDD
ncbi:MAG: LAGLIDADG family homing endonuclease [Candidatus Heimdallarchaeota archaeon]